MSETTGPLLSVRAGAQQLVDPDYVLLTSSITLSRNSKAEALTAAASALERLTTDLTSLGGVPLVTGTDRAPLAWSAHSVTTRVEYRYNQASGREEATGQVTATVALLIAVRAFDALDALGTVLARHEELNVYDVAWHVDADNPVWPRVRAAAIRAAIRKGSDYAAALGGSLLRVEHIADVGLLGDVDDPGLHRPTGARSYEVGLTSRAQGADTPSLDPVPQVLSATIEARFTATAVALPER
jgi:uncharacterized protein YggE